MVTQKNDRSQDWTGKLQDEAEAIQKKQGSVQNKRLGVCQRDVGATFRVLRGQSWGSWNNSIKSRLGPQPKNNVYIHKSILIKMTEMTNLSYSRIPINKQRSRKSPQ